jgi:hypothetical protein
MPRLVLAFLMGDQLTLSPQWQWIVFAGTGIASGGVLTLGNGYIAHVLASRKQHSKGWYVLVAGWLLYLVFVVVLASPALVASMEGKTLADTLGSKELRWAWSIVAVLSVEILAALAMVASALSNEDGNESLAQRNTGESFSDILTKAAKERLVVALAPKPEPAPIAQPVRVRARPAYQPEETQGQLAPWLANMPMGESFDIPANANGSLPPIERQHPANPQITPLAPRANPPMPTANNLPPMPTPPIGKANDEVPMPINLDANTDTPQGKEQDANEQVPMSNGEDAKALAEGANDGVLAQIISYYKENPKASQAKAANEIGCSRQLVSYHLSNLERAGAIHRNGNGVEFLVG